MNRESTYKDLEEKVKDLEARLRLYEGDGNVSENGPTNICATEFLTALLDHTSDYILICDEQGNPRVFNKAYATVMKEALGIDMEPGMRPHESLDDPEAVKYWDQLRQRALHGDRFRAEFTWDLS